MSFIYADLSSGLVALLGLKKCGEGLKEAARKLNCHRLLYEKYIFMIGYEREKHTAEQTNASPFITPNIQDYAAFYNN